MCLNSITQLSNPIDLPDFRIDRPRGLFDWLLSAKDNIRELASRGDVLLIAGAHNRVVLMQHKIQSASALAYIALLAALETNRIGRGHECLQMKNLAYPRPMECNQPLDNEIVSRSDLLITVAHARVGRKVINRPPDDLPPVQGLQLSPQQPVFEGRRFVKIEFPAFVVRKMRKIGIVRVEPEQRGLTRQQLRQPARHRGLAGTRGPGDADANGVFGFHGSGKFTPGRGKPKPTAETQKTQRCAGKNKDFCLCLFVFPANLCVFCASAVGFRSELRPSSESPLSTAPRTSLPPSPPFPALPAQSPDGPPRRPPYLSRKKWPAP